MPSAHNPRALVIGAGVAGPAAALFLARAGWDVEIFEAAAAARSVSRVSSSTSPPTASRCSSSSGCASAC